jgi:hypothetical protein
MCGQGEGGEPSKAGGGAPGGPKEGAVHHPKLVGLGIRRR